MNKTVKNALIFAGGIIAGQFIQKRFIDKTRGLFSKSVETGIHGFFDSMKNGVTEALFGKKKPQKQKHETTKSRYIGDVDLGNRCLIDLDELLSNMKRLHAIPSEIQCLENLIEIDERNIQFSPAEKAAIQYFNQEYGMKNTV